jgi:hypothetical protein
MCVGEEIGTSRRGEERGREIVWEGEYHARDMYTRM